jgi:hypothetical protein
MAQNEFWNKNKSVVVRKDTHERLKNFCDKYGYRFFSKANMIINEYLDQVESQKNKENE